MFRLGRKLSRAISSAIISVIFISACSINDCSAEVIEVSIDFDVIGSAGPEARNHHTQIWIDESLIVWGGRPEGGGVLSDGAVLSGKKMTGKKSRRLQLAPAVIMLVLLSMIVFLSGVDSLLMEVEIKQRQMPSIL